MKKLLIVTLLFLSCKIFAQPTNYTQVNQRYNWLAGYFRALHAPAGTTPALQSGQWSGSGAIYVDSSGADSGFYYYHSPTWHRLARASEVAASGITSLNGLTGSMQTFAAGTSGTDFGISSSGATHTFNLPTASASNRGALSSADWTTFNSKNFSLGWFNIVDYGAIPNDGLDDTPAIQAALNAAKTAGGGTVWIPFGVFTISGSLQTSINSTNPNCQIYIPLTTTVQDGISIRILGATPPNMEHSVLVNWPIADKGSILESTIVGSGTRPAIIGSPWASTGFGDMNLTDFYIDNVIIRARSKTGGGADTINTMTGMNLEKLGASPGVENVRVDIQSDLVDSQQPASGTVGIVFPALNNSANVKAENIFVGGYEIGMKVSEHFNGSNLIAAACSEGIRIDTANHTIHVDKYLSNGNVIAIRVKGRANFNFDNTSIERVDDLKWYDFDFDLYEDTPGLSRGNINYLPVNVTPVTSLVRNNYTATRITSKQFNQPIGIWTTTNKPVTNDSAALALNSTLGHLEFNTGGGYKTVAHIGQTQNFYTTGDGKLGINGDPTSDVYRLNIYDNAGTAPNMINMVSAGNPGVVMNTTNANGQVAFRFQKSGVTKWAYLMDFAAAGTADFAFYDQANAVARLYFNTSGVISMGGNAFTAPHFRITSSTGNVNMSTKLYIGNISTTPTEALDVSGNIKTTGFVEMSEIAAPSTPSAGIARIYVKSDGLFYGKDDAGTETKLSNDASTVKLNSILAADGTNTINSGTFAQEWQWNTLAGNTGLKLSTTSTAATGNAHKMLEVSLTGVNSTASQTTYGAHFNNAHSGTGSVNVAARFDATGGDNNYAIIVPSNSGQVGIGTVSPISGSQVNIVTALGYGAYIQNSGTGTNTYGIRSDVTGAATNNISAYFSATGGTNNYAVIVPPSSGFSGFGISNPTSTLHLAASSTGTSGSSLKINEGSRQTTPEDGTINYVSNNLEFTETSTVYILAKTLTATATLDFADTAPGATTDLTITVTGAADGDAVHIGTPNGSTASNSLYTAWVSAANTVTVRFANIQTVGNINPASGTFRAVVTKY